MFEFRFTLDQVGPLEIKSARARVTATRKIPGSLNLEGPKVHQFSIKLPAGSDGANRTVGMKFDMDGFKFRPNASVDADLDASSVQKQIAKQLTRIRDQVNADLALATQLHKGASDCIVPYPEPVEVNAPRRASFARSVRAWRRAHTTWLREVLADNNPDPENSDVKVEFTYDDGHGENWVLELRAITLATMLGQLDRPVGMKWVFRIDSSGENISAILSVPATLTHPGISLSGPTNNRLRITETRPAELQRDTIAASQMLAAAILLQRLWPCADTHFRVTTEQDSIKGDLDEAEVVASLLVERKGWALHLRELSNLELPETSEIDLPGLVLVRRGRFGWTGVG